MADLRLAAEENPAVAEMLTAVPAGAVRIEDLVQRGPSVPSWHPLGNRGGGRAVVVFRPVRKQSQQADRPGASGRCCAGRGVSRR